MYTTYFASLIDAVNQTYQDSHINTRGQIAGIIWNKTFQDSENGCKAIQGLTFGQNDMTRYIKLLTQYSADALVLVHPNESGGCALPYGSVVASVTRRAALWMGEPDNAWLFAHEMGHSHATGNNFDHCSGHRMMFDSVGQVMGGPSPDSIGVVAILPPTDAWGHGVVETSPFNPAYGFHTTMAYWAGGSQDCYVDSDPHTYGGVTRVFRFWHQGTRSWGDSVRPQWTGTFSNPSISWYDSTTDSWYPTGYDSVFYINRLKYVGGPTVTSPPPEKYNRNFVATHNANVDSVRNLRGVPLNATLTPQMRVGPNSADTQWIYSHIVAQNTVSIQSGFKVTGGHLKISVGPDGEGLLLKKEPDAQIPKRDFLTTDGSHINLRYHPIPQHIAVHVKNQERYLGTISIYDIRAKKIWSGTISSHSREELVETISVKNFSNGTYVVRASFGKDVVYRRFTKL
jgi:hypothetical protein